VTLDFSWLGKLAGKAFIENLSGKFRAGRQNTHWCAQMRNELKPKRWCLLTVRRIPIDPDQGTPIACETASHAPSRCAL